MLGRVSHANIFTPFMLTVKFSLTINFDDSPIRHLAPLVFVAPLLRSATEKVESFLWNSFALFRESRIQSAESFCQSQSAGRRVESLSPAASDQSQSTPPESACKARLTVELLERPKKPPVIAPFHRRALYPSWSEQAQTSSDGSCKCVH